jgi:hypothetical protein
MLDRETLPNMVVEWRISEWITNYGSHGGERLVTGEFENERTLDGDSEAKYNWSIKYAQPDKKFYDIGENLMVFRIEDEFWTNSAGSGKRQNFYEISTNNFPKSGAFLLKSRYPRNLLPQDQQMDIVGSFISHNRFQIHHMAHNRIFSRDAHTPMDLSGLPGNLQGHGYIIALGQRNVGGGGLTFIHHHTQFPGNQLGFGDLSQHLCQFLLDQLEGTYRLVKLYPFQSIPSGGIIAVHGRTNCTPGNAISGRIQTHHRGTQT